jgi:hypothetical protein
MNHSPVDGLRAISIGGRRRSRQEPGRRRETHLISTAADGISSGGSEDVPAAVRRAKYGDIGP